LPSETEALDELDALKRAQRGDHEAFGLVVRRYEQPCFRAAYLIVRDEMEASDVAQEAFVRAYRALSKFDARQPFRPWLLRITTNLALNSVRSAKRRRALADRAVQDAAMRPQDATGPERQAELSDEARRVWDAVAQLSAEDQELLYLRFFLESSEQELSEALGRPRGTVKSRLHRSLRRLRDVIERDFPDLAREPVGGMKEGQV
jgi:RNA polymerase sigma-70 factor (ECF subfamily)